MRYIHKQVAVKVTMSEKGWWNQEFNVEGSSTISAPKKETIMSIKVTNPTLINGRGASDFSTDELLGLIRSAEANVKSLEEISTESKTVKALIAREHAGVKAIVAILDAREVK